jgi:AcrR family transcriptional regulator
VAEVVVTSASESSGRRRRQRIPADQIRVQMFSAARDLVFAQGFSISLEELSFEEVIRKAGISRSSAYRLWPYKGDFVQDLLCDLAGPNWLGTAAFDQETIELASNVIFSKADQLKTPEGRRAALLEAVRVGVAQNLKAIAASKEWHIFVALNASAGAAGNDESRLRVVAELQHSEMTFIDKMTEFYNAMLDALGLEMRNGYTVQQFAMAGAAVVEGLSLRRLIVTAAETAARPPLIPEHSWVLSDQLNAPVSSPDPLNDNEWSLAAVSFLGIMDAMTRPRPADHSAS